MSEKPAARRTQAERTQQRREQVIREAIRLFAQNGYRGARLADIAKAAGVTEPGLLHHFPTKAHLLMAVLAERDRVDRERFDPRGRDESASPFAPLRELAEYNETVPGLVQLFTVLVAESLDEKHPGHDFFRRRYQQLRAVHVPLLREAQARGELRADISAEDLAIMLFAMMDGLQVQWLYEPEQIDMARLFERFLALFRSA